MEQNNYRAKPVKSKSDVTNAIVVQQIWPHQRQSVEHRESGAYEQCKMVKYLNEQHKQGNRISISFSLRP
jgi:hypothetical protein